MLLQAAKKRQKAQQKAAKRQRQRKAALKRAADKAATEKGLMDAAVEEHGHKVGRPRACEDAAACRCGITRTSPRHDAFFKTHRHTRRARPATRWAACA